MATPHPPSLTTAALLHFQLEWDPAFDGTLDNMQPDPEHWREEPLASVAAPTATTTSEDDAEQARRRAPLTIVPRRSLGALVGGVEAIADAIEALDDETMTPELRDSLSEQLVEALAGTKKKVDSTSAVLAMFESLEAAAKAERERLEKREAYYARQTERLSTYVLAVLTASKLDKIDGETSTLAKRMNPPSVRIDVDVATLPAEFVRYAAPPPPPPPAADKVGLKRALTAGRVIDGVRLERSARLVRS